MWYMKGQTWFKFYGPGKNFNIPLSIPDPYQENESNSNVNLLKNKEI